jgi:hypothetical protein
LREFEIIRAEWGLLDHIAMQNELQDMLHRPVDISKALHSGHLAIGPIPKRRLTGVPLSPSAVF